jgi:hypothetical protein
VLWRQEAATLTNVHLTSLRGLSASTKEAMGVVRLRALQDLIDEYTERYRAIDKETRIDHDLRPPVGFWGFSSRHLLETVDFAIKSALRGRLPVPYERTVEMPGAQLYSRATSAHELADDLAAALDVLRLKLEVAESTARQRESDGRDVDGHGRTL